MAGFNNLSSWTIGFSIVLIGILARTLLIVRQAVFTPLRRVPGPWYAPWTSLYLKVQVMSGNRVHYIHSLHQTYGPFVRVSPNEIHVTDLHTVKHIHRVGSNFRKADWYQSFNDSPYVGIFAMTDPKEHAARRRLFAQSFSNSSISKHEGQVRKKVETAVSKIIRDAQVGNADILKWFTFMATDIVGELSFGKSFDMLEQEQKTSYIRDLETTMMISGIRSEVAPLFKLAAFLPIPSLQSALKLTERLDAYGLAAMQNHKLFVEESSNAEVSSLFAKFLDPKKNHELTLPTLSAEASNLIVAGSDTTAVSLTYLMWSLLRPQHKHIKGKLMAELETLPFDASVAEINKLEYLRMVINESLRLYGAAPGALPRACPPGGEQLGPYFIPGGAVVSVQAYSLHRNGGIFRDPESFRPERWECPTQQMNEAFLPWGGGSRACLGIHLAMSELLSGAFVFFKTCGAVRLADSTTDAGMEMENYFLIAPRAHLCELTAL